MDFLFKRDEAVRVPLSSRLTCVKYLRPPEGAFPPPLFFKSIKTESHLLKVKSPSAEP